MASERPNLVSVKNDVIRVGMPNFDGAPATYLTDAPSATDTSLTVKDNTGFAQNDYVLLRDIGSQQAEIKRITAAVTRGTALTVAALTFPHGRTTKVTLMRYDQVEIYGSSSASDASPTLIGSAVPIDVRRGYTEIEATTTYAYYYARFKDSNAGTYSSYSDSVVSTGLSAQARGEIKAEFLSIYNEEKDELVSDEWLDRAINRWQRELMKRRKQWSVLRADTRLDTVQDQQGYDLPDDIAEDDSDDPIVSVKFKDQLRLSYADFETFQQLTFDHIGTTLSAALGDSDVTMSLTDSSDFAADGSVFIQGDEIDYTGNTESTGTLTGVTNIVSGGHSSGDEVWQTRTTGVPQKYTIDNGKLRLYPMPGSSEANSNVYLTYWKKFPDLADDADETLFLYPENCYLYLNWQLGLRRKLPTQEVFARQQIWAEDLEDRVAEDPDFEEVRITPNMANYYKHPRVF